MLMKLFTLRIPLDTIWTRNKSLLLKNGSKIILLLCVGDKGSQVKDIKKAKEYLIDYKSREEKYDKKK